MRKIKSLKSKLLFHLKFFFIAFYYAFRHPVRFWNALSKRGQKWALRGLISILILLIAIPTSLWYQAKHAKAAWWNDSWQYRQKIQLTNLTGADLTDFQVSTIVDTRDTSKFQATCADMRFTDSKGQPLDYWIEENNPGCGNQYTKVWIRVPKVYNGTNATSLYMYYGNPSATATQSGEKVFEFFDDFTNGTSKWTTIQSGIVMTTTNVGGNVVGSITNPTRTSLAGAFAGSENMGDVVVETNINVVSNNRGGIYFRHQQGSDVDNGYYWRIEGDNFGYSINHSLEVGIGSFPLDLNTWYRAKVTLSGTQAKLYMNDQDMNISRTVQNTTGNIGINCVDQTGPVYFDNFRVRKYASADPTTSASAEETGPGPIAYWKFDEGQGDTLKNSTSKTGLDGTLGTSPNNPTWKPESECLAGKCLYFDGTNDGINFAADNGPFSGTGSFTLQAWVRTNMTGEAYILQQRDTNGYEGEYILEINAGKVRYWDYNTGYGYQNFDSIASVNDNKWHQIIFVRDGGSGFLYIDGKLDNSTSATAKDISSTLDFAIGYDLRDNNKFFSGSIDEAKIYPYARDEDQIKQDYNAGLSATSAPSGSSASIGESPKWMTDGLVGHWKMDESSGTTVVDASGNGNTGTLTNAQETGTSDVSGNSVTTMVDTDGSLSGTDDAYNNMILHFNGACGSITDGTERTIQDYAGASPHTFTVAALAQAPDSCAYEIRHQTGGKFGNGLGFDKTNDKVALPDGTESSPLNFTTQDFTISAWIKPESIPTAMRIFIRGGYNSRGYMLTMFNGELGLGTYQTSALQETWSSAGTITSGAWQHVTAVRKGSKVWLYKNGSETGYAGRANHTDPLSTNTAGSIGMESTSTWPFHGQMDDLRIYNRALSPDEVKQLSEWGPGPVGWWKMDEGSGTTANDSSGNGNNGSFVSGGGNWVNGKYNNAINYTGTTGYIGAGANSAALDLKGPMTLEAWVKMNTPPNDSSTYHNLVGKGSNTSNYWTMGIDSWGGLNKRFFFEVKNGGIATQVFSPLGEASRNQGRWAHVTAIYDGGNILIYVNGIKVGTTAYSLGMLPSFLASPISIGYPAFGQYAGPKSDIDDVRVYNYARTAKQVQQDMAGNINASATSSGGPLPDPVAYYKMDEGHGQTAYDSSSQKIDAQLGSTTGVDATDPTWTPSGKFGRALSFDGSNDYVDCGTPSFTQGAPNLSVSTWVKGNNWNYGPSVWPNLIGQRVPGGEGPFYLRIDATTQKIAFGIRNSSNAVGEAIANNVLDTSNWHYISGIWDGSTVILYVDGVMQSVTGAVSGVTDSTTDHLLIGKARDGEIFNGQIDEVKVYNSALTSEQIKMDMNQGKELQFGGQTANDNGTAVSGQAAEYCVPGDSENQCDAPVGEWKFDEKTGGTANDASGNGNAGSFGNAPNTPTWTRGQLGSALNFDGNDYVDMGDPADGDLDVGTGDFTIETWFNINTINNSAFVSKGHVDGVCANPGTLGYIFRIYNNGGGQKLSFRTNNSDGCYDLYGLTTIGSLSAGWHHAAVTVSRGGDAILYLDGRKDNSSSIASYPSTLDNSNSLRFGSYSISPTYLPLNGKLDQVQLFKYARTPAQIAWDYNHGKPVGWWKLDEGEGGSAYDSSGPPAGGGNTGTLTNMDPPNDWVDGKFGKALDLDGSDDRISAQTTGFSPNSGSISAWVNPSSTGASDQFIFMASRDPNRIYLSRLATSGNFGFRLGSSDNVDTGHALPAGSWSHALITWYSGTYYAFLNGSQVATGSYSGLSGIGACSSIGSYDNCSDTRNSFFQGQIDDARVYNYALTADQVKQVMNEGAAIRFGD